jgi:hypothetical protein
MHAPGMAFRPFGVPMTRAGRPWARIDAAQGLVTAEPEIGFAEKARLPPANLVP